MTRFWKIAPRLVVRRWLRAAARQRVELDAGRSRARLLLDGRWPDGRRDLALTALLILALFLAIALLWPRCVTPNAVRGRSGSSLLNSLWQVEAAAVALSAAVMVFAVQTYHGSKLAEFGLTATDWARETRLERTVIFGFAAIFVTGFALVAFPHGDKESRASVGALAIGVFAIVMTAVMLGTALRRIAPQSIYDQRLERIRRRLVDEVSAERVQEIATALMGELAAAAGVKVLDDHALVALGSAVNVEGVSGTIVDVDRFALLLAIWPRNGSTGAVGGSLVLGRRVDSGNPLLATPPAARWRRTLLRISSANRFVRLEDEIPAHPDDDDDVAAMKAESKAAIASRDERWYQRVVQSHLAVLDAGARTWGRYVDPAEAGWLPVNRSFRAIHKSVVAQVSQALVSGQPELALILMESLEHRGRAALRADRALGMTILTILRDVQAAAYAHGDVDGTAVGNEAIRTLFLLLATGGAAVTV